MLLLVVASLMMFTFPDREPLVERFSDESCDVPVTQDVPFLSRQQSGDTTASAKKWSEPPPWLSWDRRTFAELQALAASPPEPSPVLSAPHRHATARGPPLA